MATTITSMFFCLFNSKNLAKCLKKMSILDDTLKELGFQTEYKNIRKLMIFVIIGWLVTVVLLNLSEIFLHLKDNNLLKIISTCLINQPVHNNTILDLIFIILLLYERTRFCKLNEYVTQRCKTRDRSTKIMPESLMTSTTNYSNGICTNEGLRGITNDAKCYDIWMAMHIHLELSKICNNLNTIFGAPMLLEMISFFIGEIGLISELYITLTNSNTWESLKIKKVLDILIWSMFYTIKLLSINYTCEIVKAEANRTQVLIQKVMDSFHIKIREEVFQFISELTYKRLKFSAFGFYEYGYKFIQQFFGGITTFLIILLQMETSPDVSADITTSPTLTTIESNLYNRST
ncbi:gustatory receptor 68a-like [Vespula squamosa]|uniref:Gustatory receptor n=1 Tax=Vespula squamosa TaxID=30214 RepID=A0ABD1ZTD0_VESSQ